MAAVANALMDDVFDVLEGALAEVIRTRQLIVEGDDRVVLQRQVSEARAAVAMLTALMREGRVWRPAADGRDAIDWRSTLLATCEEVGAPGSYVALLRRELDELVALAPRGARRPLPTGLFERLARRAGVRREACISWARAAGDDLLAGWAACDDARSVVRIVLELGITPHEIMRAVCRALGTAAPRSDQQLGALVEQALANPAAIDARSAQALAHAAPTEIGRAIGYAVHVMAGDITPLRAEWACERAQRLGLLRQVTDALTTSAMRERLAGEGGN